MDPRRRARDLLRRTAPMLRDVNAAIEQNGALRETRDALVDKAGDLVQKADDALGRMTAIEGTVVEPAQRDATAASGAAEGAPDEVLSGKPSPSASPPRQPHWTRQRLARMASAAATEAVRPHRPLVDRRTGLRLAAAGLVGLVAWALLRRRS